MREFPQLLDLTSERLGGRLLAANCDFLASQENVIKPAAPVSNEDKDTSRGKWMDGWKLPLRGTSGHNWFVLQLGLPGKVSQVTVDTRYPGGNYPESCSIDACAVGETLRDSDVSGFPWKQVLVRSPLKGDSLNTFAIQDAYRYTHLRLNIYPDGGVAKLRVLGEAIPDWGRVLGKPDPIDLAAAEYGGCILACSDEFSSTPQNLLMPGSSAGMHDGWETKRRHGPGQRWVAIRLGIAGTISAVEVDTSYFKENFPESCSVEICCSGSAAQTACTWSELLPRVRLTADSVHRFGIPANAPATHVRFNTYADGGVARLRIYGCPNAQQLTEARLRWLNSLPETPASQILLNCCGSRSWSVEMAQRRPFASFEALADAATRSFELLTDDDWKEAFAAHPKIGENRAGSEQSECWSKQEQSAAAAASSNARQALQQRNQEYHSQFGYIFIVCASGKSAEEMLVGLEERLGNNPAAELKMAAREQRKITQLRLQKLIGV